MSKRTIILLNEKNGWVAGGQDGASPQLQEWSALPMGDDKTVEALVDSISEAINHDRLPRRRVVLILGPSYLEYRPFQVPPVDARELPAIAQMLARTQLTQASDESAVDFVPMPNSSTQGTPQAFIGATTQKARLLIETLEERGIQLDRILPRTTTLGLLHNDPSDRQFWINVLPHEIDVFVAGLEQLLLVRSSIIPAEGPAREKSIRREVTRTLAVLAAEYGTTSHRRIEVAGPESDRAAVKSAFDPDAESEGGQCHDLLSESIGQVSVDVPSEDLGMVIAALAALAEKHAPLLDFANPTQPPKDSEATRKMVLVGATIATAVICLIGLAWLNLRSLDNQLATLQDSVAAMEVSEPTNQQVISDVGRINAFLTSDVGALEILESFSEKLPYGDKFRVHKLTVGVDQRARSAGGDGMEVVLDSRVAADGMNLYREALNQLETWQIEPDPRQSPGIAKESEYYEEGVSERLQYLPSFMDRYDQFANVVYAATQAEQGTSEDVPAEASSEGSTESEAGDGPLPDDSGSEQPGEEGRISTSIDRESETVSQ